MSNGTESKILARMDGGFCLNDWFLLLPFDMADNSHSVAFIGRETSGETEDRTLNALAVCIMIELN